MPSINLITTTAGRAAILAAIASSDNLVVANAQISDTNQSVGVGTTALSSIVATLTATGSVRTAGAGHALHVVLSDDSTAAYDVRALALRLNDGTFLMVYSQMALIATKAAGASLHLAIDLTVDAATAGTITFGTTDWALPAASEETAGAIELATAAEVDSAHVTRAVTPYHVNRVDDRTRHYMAVSNWTPRTAGGGFTGGFEDIAFGAGVFVAVGTAGEIQTSPDGTTWTHRTAAASYADVFKAVHFADGLFVAVGENGEIQTSPDGTTWTHRTQAASYAGDFQCVTYSAALDLWVIAGETGEIQTSPNGTAWTHRTAGSSYAQAFLGAAWNATLGLFVLVGDYGGGYDYGQIQTSPDGTTWTRRAASQADLEFVGLDCVCSHAGGFVAAGHSGCTVLSADGLTWEAFSSGVTSTSAYDIVAGDGCFIVPASNNSAIWVVSPDGSKVDVLPRAGVPAATKLGAAAGIQISAMLFADRRFVAVGARSGAAVILESLYL